MQAIILSGGRGSRLSTLTGGLPKSLVEVAGKPLLHRQIELLAEHRVSEILLLVSYGADRVRSACGDGSTWGVTIRYVEDRESQGTAGAVLQAYPYLQEQFIVLYGDTVLSVDLPRFWAAHLANRADATLFVHPNDHPQDSDIVQTAPNGRILAFHAYPHQPDLLLPNCVNAALYVLERRNLDGILPGTVPFDFGKHLFPLLLQQGKLLYAYRSREYIKDAGTPERLAIVDADVRSGRVRDGSLNCPVPAIFFDRDGTLVADSGYIGKPDQLALLPGASAAIRRVNRTRYVSVLVTNQPVVARGETDEPGLQLIHNRLEQLLGRDNAYLDAIYYCPHHPDRGFSGERQEYKVACDCRKPEIGMILRATQDMNVDLAASWLIGDTYRDLETAARAGILSALVGGPSGTRAQQFAQRPDFQFPSVGSAVDFILDLWPQATELTVSAAERLQPGTLVLVGGLARSGKSSFASTLAWTLRRRYGKSAVVVSLDGWLKPLEQRVTSSTVIDRFDIASMQQQISEAITDTAATLRVPLYNRTQRRPDASYVLRIDPSDIVILEGVIALLVHFASPRPLVRIYVSRDEGARRESMAADYRLRNRSEEEIAALYAERQRDEAPYVAAGRQSADVVFDTP